MNRLKTLIVAGLALLGAGALPSLQAQDVVSLKLTSPKTSNQNYMYAADYGGAPGVRTNNWNNLLATADGNSSPITLLAGSISNAAGNILPTLQVSIHPTTSAGGGGVYNRQNGGTNDGKLFADVSDTYQCNAFANYGYLDITNIPYTNYNIYCYFRPDNGNGSANTRGGFFLITNTPVGYERYYLQNQSNDVAQTQLGDPSTAAGYVQAMTTAIPSGGAAWSSILGADYAVFTGLTNAWTRVWFGGLGNGTGGKDDLGNYVNGGSGAVRFKVAGFQIVQVNSGLANALYFSPSNTTLHAGNPAGTQSTLMATLVNGTTVNVSAVATYTLDNSNVVAVSAAGLLTPGTNGTAHVVASYQSLLATNTVTVIGPTSLSISVAKTNLLVGNGQGDSTTATLYANFSDVSNVVVNAYNYVSFSGTPGILTATTNGTLTATGAGGFNVTGIYDQVTVTTNLAGGVALFQAPVGPASFAVDVSDGTHGMTFHDLSGAPGARLAYWNRMVCATGNVTNQVTNPTDDQGNALTGTVVQMIPGAPTANSELVYTEGTLTTNESTLFGVVFDLGVNNGVTYDAQLVVSNLPYASYDAYFYFYNDNTAPTRPGEVVIDGVTQYRINSASAPTQPDNNGNGYVQAVQPAAITSSIASVPYGNYIKFTGLTDSTLNVGWGGVGQDVFLDANAVTRLRLVGFQIVGSLDGLKCTNVFLAPSVVPAQLPGNPAVYPLVVLGTFTNGTSGNITALSGISFASSNPNIFSVDGNGNLTPGLTPGVATLTIGYQTNLFTTPVTNLAPTAVNVVATPATVYIDSTLGVQPATAAVVASFPGQPSVNISAFTGVSYVDQGAAAATLNSDGSITANATGTIGLGGTYLGTTYVTPNAFTVASISGSPVLKHQYNFTDAATSTKVVDAIGGANGTIYAPLSSNKPITLDGARAIFPGDGNYTDEPYIALPAGIIGSMGDVSIELWGGQTQLNVWARFLGFGSTPKGLTPYALGGTATSGLQLMASYGGTGHADFYATGVGDNLYTTPLTNGAEYQFVAVYAPNAGVLAFYVNGVLVASGTPASSYLNTFVDDTVDWLGVSLSNNDAPLAGWMNNLAIYEGVIPAAQVAADYAAGQSVYLPPVQVSTTPVPISFTLTSGSLNLSWPPDHQGWRLQVQTNALSTGLGNNWVTVPGSTTVTNVAIPVAPANGAVFYRLVYP